jgi:hypothetical protein
MGNGKSNCHQFTSTEVGKTVGARSRFHAPANSTTINFNIRKVHPPRYRDTRTKSVSLRCELLGLGLILVVSLPVKTLSADGRHIEQLVGYKNSVKAPGVGGVSMEEIFSFFVEDTQAWKFTLVRLFHRLVTNQFYQLPELRTWGRGTDSLLVGD